MPDRRRVTPDEWPGGRKSEDKKHESMEHQQAVSRLGSSELFRQIEAATDAELDELPFGVIGFDGIGRVTRYNRFEAELARLDPARVKGRHLFTAIAPCMNNPLISGQFRDAQQQGQPLDETIDYVLAFKHRPVPVTLRMLYQPPSETRYLVIHPQLA